MPDSPFILVVAEDAINEAKEERLDKFLASELSDNFSRERIKTLILEGRVLINGKLQTKAAFRLKEGDTIALSLPVPEPLQLLAEPIPLDVVYEDDCLLVVNKPRGMLTHPAGREQTGTLVNALLYHCHGRLSGINGILRPGIVHRLDRDTAGLLVVAKTEKAHRVLAEQMKLKTARREYYAVVQGNLSQDTGTVNAPIGRNPKHREKMAVISTGRPSVTHWEVLERIHGKFTWVRLRLETGRTHQIRVHMSHIGYPVVGDPQYGHGIEKVLKLNTAGQLLQAFRLGFIHPENKSPMAFEIPLEPMLADALVFLKALA